MGPIAPEYMEKVDFTDEVQEQSYARQRYGRLGDGCYVELGQLASATLPARWF
jgi:hypothetical protein